MINPWKIIILVLLTFGFCEDAFSKRREFCEAQMMSSHLAGSDAKLLSEFAQQHGLIIGVMAPNPASLRYRYSDRARPKTADLKNCKSAPSGKNAGLIFCPPSHFSSEKAWLDFKSELATKGYEVLGAEHNYLVRRLEDDRFFFSDYDLLFINHSKSKEPAYSETLRGLLNRKLGRRLIRHGPLAEYEKRHEVPVKFPVLVFLTDASVLELHSTEELQAFYQDYRLSWPF